LRAIENDECILPVPSGCSPACEEMLYKDC